MKTLTIIFLLLSNISHCLAETTESQENLKEYDIEIIIFEDAHARYINSESWRRDSSAAEEVASDSKTKRITKKSTELYTAVEPKILSKEYKRINNSSEFNVLLYSAWSQVGLKDSDAFKISINELKNIHRGKSKNTITGKIKIVLARYLHFYSQLEYQRQDNKNQPADLEQNINITVNNENYLMKNHRRMRSKELHYIDHPLVGILIQINPVKINQIEQPEQANAAQFQNVVLINH